MGTSRGAPHRLEVTPVEPDPTSHRSITPPGAPTAPARSDAGDAPAVPLAEPLPPRYPVLEPFGDQIWTAPRPMRFWGIETGTRMTVIRLDDGGLFVHSPVALDPPTRTAVAGLGLVKVIVAPSRFHHLFVPAWREAWPEALLCACPGLEQKRSDISWDRVLGNVPEGTWRGQLDQVFFSARSLENEVVFFHPRSHTLVCADMVFHLASHPSPLTRVVAWLLGNGQPGATFLERLLIRDRREARAQIDRILAWDFDRILLAHGEPIREGGRQVVRRAYAWL